MSPIEGISDVVRLPRLGKIKLGRMVETPGKNPRPQATDHFVCPKEVEAVCGPAPTELEIMFPDDDPEVVAQQWLRRYSLTQGLVCIGDGVKARRKVDTATGDFAGHQTARWEWKEGVPCDQDECPEYRAKRCRRVMNLQFLLPDVPGLGVWEIATTSRNSIININNMIRIVRSMTGGRLAFIPLTLVLSPEQVTPPGEKTKTAYCLHLKADMKVRDLVRAAMLSAPRMLMPPADIEEPPEEMSPQQLGEAGAAPAPGQPQTEPGSGAGETAQDSFADFFPETEKTPGAQTLATTTQLETLRRLAPQAGYKTWETFKLWAEKQYNLAAFGELTLDQAEDALEKVREIVTRRGQEL